MQKAPVRQNRGLCCVHVSAVLLEGGVVLKNRGWISQLAVKLRGLSEQYYENNENFRKSKDAERAAFATDVLK